MTMATRNSLLALATVLALASPPAVQASSVTCCGMGHDVHFRDRLDASEARMAITTEDGEVTLILTDRDVAFQLSDGTMRRVRRELKHAREDHDNVIANAIATVVTNTVGEVLDHSMVCHVSDLRDVSYADGRLVFIGRRGRAVFHNTVRCGDSDALHRFSERDAQEFVQEFRRVKAGE